MIDSITRITLNLQETNTMVSIRAKRGDTGRKLLIHLSDGSIPYHISDDCYATFTAKKPDGTKINNACTIENNVIEYEFTDQTCTAVGTMKAEIRLYGADDKMITSACFLVNVYDTVFRDGDEVGSETEMNTLDDLILRANAFLNETGKLLRWQGNWDSEMVYEANDLVLHEEVLYVAEEAIAAGTAPGSEEVTAWVPIAGMGTGSGGEVVGIASVKNVKLYGAAGDGNADDTNAIAEAIADCVPGDTLYFPAGVYRVSNINLKSNMTVRGDGWSSVIQLLDNTTDYHGRNNCLNIENVQNIIVRDIKLDGRGAAQAATAPAQDARLNGLHIRHASHILVENVWMYNNGYHGCIMTYTSDVVFSHCKVTDNGFRPIHGHTQIYNCRVSNCVCENNGLNLITGGSGFENDSIFFFGAQNLTISDNIVKSNRRGCITVGSEQDSTGEENIITSRNITISGNVCECYEDLEYVPTDESDTGVAKFSSMGIVVYGGDYGMDNVAVTGNTIRNAHEAIYLYSQEKNLVSVNASISGNTIMDCSYGVYATNLADVILADNQFQNLAIAWMYAANIEGWQIHGNNVRSLGSSESFLLKMQECRSCALRDNVLIGRCDYALYVPASNADIITADNTLYGFGITGIHNPNGSVFGNTYTSAAGTKETVCVDPYANAGFVRPTLVNPNTSSSLWRYTTPVEITEDDTLYELNTYITIPVEHTDPTAYDASTRNTAIVFLTGTDLTTAVGIVNISNGNGDVAFSETYITGASSNIWGVGISLAAERVKELFPTAAYVMMQVETAYADPDNLGGAYHNLNDGHAYVYRLHTGGSKTIGDDVELDVTLTQSGKAADAKAVGGAISKLSGGNVAYDEAQELTDEQKARARENIGAQPAGNYLTEVPDGYAKTEDIPTDEHIIDLIEENAPDGIAVTGATVGQTVKISAVDENGVPTAWESVDFPSGEGGARMRLIADITTEEDLTKITVSEDKDGNPFALTKIAVRGYASGAEGAGGYIGCGVNGSGLFTNLGLTANSVRDYMWSVELNEDGTVNAMFGGGGANSFQISGFTPSHPKDGGYGDSITSIHFKTGTIQQLIAAGSRFKIYGA